jgi:thiamine pyrophosphate-dependent acetolactate synthase large subunit-like protein
MAAWLRTLATRYEIPILAVVQAGGEAENQKWLHMGMLYNSKTGIQGEADLLVGVGYEHDDDRTRFVSILKNKLPGGPRTVPSMKHGKFSCNFSPETGRFYNLKCYR